MPEPRYRARGRPAGVIEYACAKDFRVRLDTTRETSLRVLDWMETGRFVYERIEDRVEFPQARCDYGRCTCAPNAGLCGERTDRYVAMRRRMVGSSAARII